MITAIRLLLWLAPRTRPRRLGRLRAVGTRTTRGRATIYKQLVEINTTDTPAGNVTKAAEAVAARLKAAGFPAADMQVLGPDPRKGNLVAATAAPARSQPLLLLAHLDVVEAKREDWSIDPFVFAREGRLLLRPRHERRQGDGVDFVANLIRLKEEGLQARPRPDPRADGRRRRRQVQRRRLAGEEPPDLIDAEFAINEGGGGTMRTGKYLTNEVQASEKVYQDFHLETNNPGRPQLAAGEGQRDLPPRRAASRGWRRSTSPWSSTR